MKTLPLFPLLLPLYLSSSLTSAQTTGDLINNLEEQYITDQNGYPIYETQGSTNTLHSFETQPHDSEQAASLPPGTRSWESTPGVIRNDGIESFRVEVNTNGSVREVRIDAASFYLIEPSSNILRDDGLEGDKVAGDGIYTSGEFKFDTSKTLPPHYLHDTNSPPGIFETNFGPVIIEEIDGTETQFLLQPSVGILSKDIPATKIKPFSEDLVASPNLINIRSSQLDTQKNLRQLDGDLRNITSKIYESLPDSFDFLVLYSANKIERSPQNSRENFISQTRRTAQRKAIGTGYLSPFNSSNYYGSSGRLLSINILDTYRRGIQTQNVIRGILHQWSAYITPSLGITTGSSYSSRSSVGSLLGSRYWNDLGNGNFEIDCSYNSKKYTTASPLDKYLMGLIDGSLVPEMYAYSNELETPNLKCLKGENIIYPDEIVSTVTIEDIQNLYGTRFPGPENAQRQFNVGFIIESHGRFLTDTEMTYYQILSEYFSRSIPDDTPLPSILFSWVPVEGYFGEGTTWNTKIPGASMNEVQIDILPNYNPNFIHCKTDTNADRVIPETPIRVGVLSNKNVDATNIDLSTLIFSGAHIKENSAVFYDIDGDSDDDLEVLFDPSKTHVECEDISACIFAQTNDGEHLYGCDNIVTF